MSTSDTSIAQQGRTHRHSTTRTTPSTTASHKASNFQAHSSNSQFDYSSPQPATPPRTPRRDASGASAENNGYTSNDAPAIPPNSSAKTKSKTKNRPKHVVTSPSASRNVRATPPLTGAQSAGLPKHTKTPSSIAYAGPTFHASPAPSALPLPSFYSKSVPESPAPIAINSAKDETSSSNSDSPTPPTSQLNGREFQREESPLDFFFVADRAERARARGSSSASGPFQPPLESPPVNHTPTNPRAHSSYFSGGRPSSMFAMELESTDSLGKPFGAPFATPYSERIKAARSLSTQSQPLTSKSQVETPSDVTSQALRDYIFSGTPPPSDSPASDAATIGSSIRSTSGPPTPFGGPQIGRHSNHSYHTDFPFGNESVPHNSFRTTSRSSGLRQEVSQTRTPNQRPEISDRVTSAPPKMSTNPSFVNNASNQHINSGISSNSSSTDLPNGVTSQRSRSDDLLDLEERLRRQLKMEPAKKSSEGGFPYGPPDSVPGYRATSMNDGYNGVLGS